MIMDQPFSDGNILSNVSAFSLLTTYLGDSQTLNVLRVKLLERYTIHIHITDTFVINISPQIASAKI